MKEETKKELKERLLETKELVKEYVDKTDKFLLVTDERVVSVGSKIDMVTLLTSLIANLKDNGVAVEILKHAYELGVAENRYEYMKNITKDLIEKEKEKIKEMEEFLK